MAGICGKISSSILYDCSQNLVGGTKNKLVLINRADISAVTYSTGNSLTVTNIIKNAGASGYAFEGYRHSVDVSYSVVVADYSVGYNHGPIIFRLFNYDSTTKIQLEQMAKADLVAVIENNFQGADSRYEIYGLSAGLYMTAFEVQKSVDLGQFTITLSSDKYKEARLPATLYAGDPATTTTVYNNLLIAG